MNNWVNIREDKAKNKKTHPKKKLDLICTFDTIINVRNNNELALFKTIVEDPA